MPLKDIEARRAYDRERGKLPHRRAYDRNRPNKAERLAYVREWRASERGKAWELEFRRKYRATPKGKEVEQAAARKWYATPHGHAVRRAEGHARRAAGELTAEDVMRLLDEAGGRCVYCGREAPLEIEHILPVARGGTNAMSNLAAACRSCNSSKGAKTVDEWRKREAA